ncbi:hypothetical protein NXS19_011941 [Fusarium pseudograminearum]|nr:hypothetical protein NXS19_011941 [Fusarium pseudograminearum]
MDQTRHECLGCDPAPESQLNSSTTPKFARRTPLAKKNKHPQGLSQVRTAKMSDAQANEAEKNIEIWKVKKLIKRLEAARGNGTSMISIIRKPLNPFASISERRTNLRVL